MMLITSPAIFALVGSRIEKMASECMSEDFGQLQGRSIMIGEARVCSVYRLERQQL